MKRQRKRPPIHPHDEIHDYEATLLEQTRSRPGSWVDEEYRQHAIRWLADKARQLPLKQSRPPVRQAELRKRRAQERQQKHERETFYVPLRARYFVKIASRSAKGQTLKKSNTSEALIEEAAKKFGMRPKDIEFEARIASFYGAVNDKWKEWVASIREPQARTLWAHVRGTKVPNITHHRPQWSVDRATARAAKVVVRMIKRASAGVEWPDVRVQQLFADFSEDTLRRHFRNRFAKIIRRELAARNQEPGRG